MKCLSLPSTILLAAALLLAAILPARAETGPTHWFNWTTVVNNLDTIPGTDPERNFNSYNQPSVSANGVVVFRARSRGGQGLGPATHGIYTRDMADPESAIVRILDRTTEVPAPNNLGTTFVETPSFPRIDRWWDTVATRGNHPPVWTYIPLGGEETRAGTTGIYTTPWGTLRTGAAKLGMVPEFAFLAVPDVTPGVPFEVFPGSPAVTGGATIVFKGNFTIDGVGQTGVYFRNLEDAPVGGLQPVVAIADTLTTVIPGSKDDSIFGSLAPPSAEAGWAVFAGFDDEQNPGAGGLYLAPLASRPELIPLVEIGRQVPGEPRGTTFASFGEGVAFDGRTLAFWGYWGGKDSRTLACPTEGNKDRIDYCNHLGVYADGLGDPNSDCRNGVPCTQEVEVPRAQGIFRYDLASHKLRAVAKAPDDFDDFLFWNYSGMVPGATGGETEDGEPARWRSSAFTAVSGRGEAPFSVAFKAVKENVTGIYLGWRAGRDALTVLDTTMSADLLDPDAPDGARVTEVGLEREGFREGWLALAASMGVEGGSEEEGMAGIYLTRVPGFRADADREQGEDEDEETED